METQDFTTTIIIAATPKEVFDAVNNVRGWWSENIEGETDKPGSTFLYHYQDVHRCRMKITECTPDKKVVWQVADNYFKFTKDKSEWKDTHVIFEIFEKDGTTQLKFTHQGLVPQYECFKICHDAWTYYIQESLKMLITTGTGNPTPKETAVEHKAAEKEVMDAAAAKRICQRLLIKVPVEKVYKALTTREGLAGWWTPETTAKPEVGSVSKFVFGPDYFKEMEIIELQPYSKVKWICRNAFEEWIGTTLTFELEPHAKGSVLFFQHDGWKAYTPEFASCTYAWALFFRSLKFFCETGKGFPFPEFDK